MCLAFAMTLGMAACKTTPAPSSSEPSSSVETTPDDTSSAPEEEPEDTLQIPDEDLAETPEEDEPSAELPTEKDFSAYADLQVQNASDPLNKNFHGINGVHMGFGYMPPLDGREPVDKKLLEQEYDRIAYTMGVHQIRTFYTSSMVWDSSANAWNFDVKTNPHLSGFYDSLKALQKRGIEVGMSPQWSMASFVGKATNTGNITSFHGAGFYVADDLDATCAKYSDFMKQTVLSLKANGINNVKYLFAFTECNNTFITENQNALKAENDKLAAEGKPAITKTAIELRDYDRVCAVYHKAIDALDVGLKDAGLRKSYKIVGPCDNFRTDFDYVDAAQYSILSEYTIKNLADKVDIIGSHGGYSNANQYTDDTYYYNPEITMGKTKEMANAIGKEYWIDEYNVRLNSMLGSDFTYQDNRDSLNSPVKGLAMALTTLGGMNAGMDNMFIWSLADIQWPNTTNGNEWKNGLQIGGYLPSPTESVVPYYGWYAVSLLSKYVGQGDVYHCLDDMGLFTTAIKRTDGEWTVVVMNYNVEDALVHINFEKSLGGKTFYRHNYDLNSVIPSTSASLIGVSARAKNVTTGFCDTMTGYSMAVYTTVK